MKDLSILIPARNEKYLERTLNSLSEKIRGDTEILVGLDGGELPMEMQYKVPNIFMVRFEQMGQRAVINQLAKMSTSKYLMKVDAHVILSEGFDVEMMREMDDKTIMAPVMLKLDAENWRPMPQYPTSFFGFDPDLVTQIDRSRQTKNLIDESMCLHGSAWMIDRKTYFKWNVCDESLGSWGGQGTELGIKAFLHGGRCAVNKNCYYAHLERIKHDDFPYDRGEHPGQNALEALRKRYKNISLAPLIERFNYPTGWTKELVANLPQL